MRTAACGRAAIVKLLLEHKADPEDAGYGGLPVLYFALAHSDVVHVLLDAGANPRVRVHYRGNGRGPRNTTLLHEAAAGGHVDTVKRLLAAGVPIDGTGAGKATPLVVAARGGQPKMVQLLLAHKASIRGEIGRNALAGAAAGVRPDHNARQREQNARYKAVIGILQAQGIPLDLFPAIALNKVERVRELLKKKRELASSKDRADRLGTWPLTRAVDLDRPEIVGLLLDAGAPINGGDDHGYTALHSAAFWGRDRIAKVLIERKADVNATDNTGFTPLHESARLNTPAVAKLLLAAGAKVNAKDNEGRTPLSWAKADGSPRDGTGVAELLRKHGGTK
jgi:ankyrin repeat protein